MVNNQDLLLKIEEWQLELSTNDKHIHFALLEIFIEFEKFLANAFIEYSLGFSGKDNYLPERRITFADKRQLEGLLKCDKQYIDYIKKIQEIKHHVFAENTCPFTKVFSTADFMTNFRQMQMLRNFIAHQSEESKNKYITKVLNSNGISAYIKSDTFLKRISRSNSRTYYSMYIETLRFNSEIICNPI